MKTALWQAIKEALAGEISAGHYAPGSKMPSEAELSRRFGVNRHTVRQALAALASDGLVRARRGAGVFVTPPAIEYALGVRPRFHHQIAAGGKVPGRRFSRLETRGADAREAERLGLSAAGAMVHVVEGVSLIDASPVSFFRSLFDAQRFKGLCERLPQTGSITAALAEEGLSDYTRASTKLSAENANATMALALETHEGAALLHSIAVNIDAEGCVVEYGEAWFVGERVMLTVQGG